MNNASPSHDSSASSPSTIDETVTVPRVSIDWYRSLPWWRLLSQSVSISWRASHLLLAAAAILATVLGWHLGERAFDPEGIDTISVSAAFESARMMFVRIREWSPSRFVVSTDTFDSLTLRRLAYWLFGILWTIGVWSFAGGLLARRSVMEMGIRTSVGWGPSCRLVCRRWLSMLWGISMPLVAIFGLALLPLALGIIARMGVIGLTFSLIMMIPVSLLAIGIGWCGAISALGFPLSICAIVAEKNADAFDGISRSAAYVFQRPMTLLTILILAIGLAWLGDFIVQTVLMFGENVLWAAFSVGLGGELKNKIANNPWLPVNLHSLAKSVVPALRAAFVCSFFWSAAAAAYLTLRWEIDHTDFDELDLQELGEPVPLPSFAKDERGVAEAVEPSP